jgi:tetratricopeptide (TPR) repeat protein
LAPSLDRSYLLLAQLYVSAGKEQAALDRLNGLVSKTNSAVVYMEIGEIQDMLKDYPKARDAYEKVIAIQPDFVPALNNLSYLYSERLNELDKGYQLAERARQLSHDPSAADTLGWILFKKGDYTRARGLIEESASKMASQPEVQYHLGMVRYMLGDEEAARASLQQAADSTQDFPGKDQAVRHLAILAVDPRTADAKTQADLEKRLQEEPNDPVAANRLGAIYERTGALDKAAKTYEQSLKENPQNAQIMARLGRIYMNLNQFDKALDVAKDAHKLAPDDAVISCLLGRLVFQSGDYSWAASLLQEAAPKVPSQPEVQYDLAWSYYSIGRVNDAERTMQAAAPALTGSIRADAKQFLAMVAAARTPTPAAQAQATQILGTNSDYVPAIMASATQAEQSGKADDAIKLYEKALAHYPAFSPAARNVTILYAEHPGGDDQKAYDLGVKARGVYPDDMKLERAVGVLAYRRGEYSRAVQLLQDSSQALNDDGELFYYLGMAQYQLKHAPQSKAALQRALALNTKSADDARKVLAELK